MPPRGTCYACRSAHVDKIDALIREGRLSRREIARKYGIGRVSVDNHFKKGHVPPAGSGDPPVIIPSGDPLDILTTQRDVLDSIDVSKLAPAMQMALFAERRRTAEALAKMAPREVVDPPSARELRALDEMQIVILEVVERHPEVMKEVATAIHEWKSRRKG